MSGITNQSEMQWQGLQNGIWSLSKWFVMNGQKHHKPLVWFFKTHCEAEQCCPASSSVKPAVRKFFLLTRLSYSSPYQKISHNVDEAYQPSYKSGALKSVVCGDLPTLAHRSWLVCQCLCNYSQCQQGVTEVPHCRFRTLCFITSIQCFCENLLW